jgi:ribosome-associated translation inhibitor RaiA
VRREKSSTGGLIEIKDRSAVGDKLSVLRRLEVAMSFTLQIAFRNMDASASAEALVRQRAEELEHLLDRISACRVVLDCVHRQNQMGRLYHVHIDLTLPGGKIVVNHDNGSNHAHDDLQLAIRDSFEAARRQLAEYMRKHDGIARRRAAE